MPATFDLYQPVAKVPEYVADRIMWQTVCIVLLHMRTRRISAT